MKKKRPLGQNFLVRQDIADQIVEMAPIAPEDTVLEIGPGKGILTRQMLGRAKRVIGLEIDPKLYKSLQKKFSDFPNYQGVLADALKYDYALVGSTFHVVANLPYYAGTPILKRLLLYAPSVLSMTLMLQKEVADRLCASPGTREFGSLSVFVQYHCAVERLLEVGPSAFDPPPKIKSTVLRLIPHATPPIEVKDSKTLFRIVHAAFFHKRKTLKNNFKALTKQLGFDLNTLKESGVDLNRRAESLGLEDFAKITRVVEAQNV